MQSLVQSVGATCDDAPRRWVSAYGSPALNAVARRWSAGLVAARGGLEQRIPRRRPLGRCRDHCTHVEDVAGWRGGSFEPQRVGGGLRPVPAWGLVGGAGRSCFCERRDAGLGRLCSRLGPGGRRPGSVRVEIVGPSELPWSSSGCTTRGSTRLTPDRVSRTPTRPSTVPVR